MISDITSKYSIQNWAFLDIEEETLKDRYPWWKTDFPVVKNRYSWAVRDDIQRLMFLCISFDSKVQLLDWTKHHSQLQINQVHLTLIDFFCYSARKPDDHLDFLIENSDELHLLNFIHQTLERALLWYNPEYSWPSTFSYVLRKSKDAINKVVPERLEPSDLLIQEGVEFDYTDVYTYVFYKFERICKQLEEGLIYSDIKTLAKQVQVTLVTSINACLHYKALIPDNSLFERKVEYITKRETEWCASVLEKLNLTCQIPTKQ